VCPRERFLRPSVTPSFALRVSQDHEGQMKIA
jgi:hypothetical protein